MRTNGNQGVEYRSMTAMAVAAMAGQEGLEDSNEYYDLASCYLVKAGGSDLDTFLGSIYPYSASCCAERGPYQRPATAEMPDPCGESSS